MALDNRQMKALQYTLKGLSNTEIGELLGVERTTVWRWTQKEEWKKAFNDMQREIRTQGENKILGELDVYVEEIKKLALTSNSEKTKLDALTYLIDRVMGRTTTKVQDITEDNDNKDNFVDLDNIVNDIKKDKKDGKVIKFPNNKVK